MYPAWPKPRLSHHETATLGAKNVRSWNADVLEQQLSVSLTVEVTKDAEVAHVSDAGRIERHDHHALLRVSAGLWVCLPHHN